MVELKVTTPEEYAKLNSRLLKVHSGAVFHITAATPKQMVYIIDRVPEGGLLTQHDILRFVEENYDDLLENAIQPNIIAPKMPDDKLMFMDVVNILTFLLGMGGGESFPEEGDGDNA